MNRKQALSTILKQFKKADEYNQLRPGETTLAIHSFLAGMNAILRLATIDKLTKAEFRMVLKDLGDYFDEFEDSTTKQKEIC